MKPQITLPSNIWYYKNSNTHTQKQKTYPDTLYNGITIKRTKTKQKTLRHNILRLYSSGRTKEIFLNPGTHINIVLEYMSQVKMYFGSELFLLFHTACACTSHHKIVIEIFLAYSFTDQNSQTITALDKISEEKNQPLNRDFKLRSTQLLLIRSENS